VKRGNPDLKSEKLIAYEMGLRFWRETGMSADLAVFLNDYTDLRSNESSPPPFGKFDNSLAARTYGGELAVGWQLAEWAGVRAFYNLLEMNVRRQPGSTDTRSEYALENSSPRQSGGVRLSLQPRGDVTADTFVRYVDPLPATATPSYIELNQRVSWKPWSSLELALVGENLLDPHHPESGSIPSASQPVQHPSNEIQRSLFAEFSWTWH
jgi:iron complex outermembrane receptor protein